MSSLVSDIPSGIRAGPYVPAMPGLRLSTTPGTFGVGGITVMGAIPQPGSTAKGKTSSNEKVITSLVSKRWGAYAFEQDQQHGQLLWCVRASGAHRQEVPMATMAQFNALMRDMHQTARRHGLSARLAALDPADKNQVDDFIDDLRAGTGNLMLLGTTGSRITNEVRGAALQYFSVQGILERWNYLGVFATPTVGQPQEITKYLVNVAVQGPEYTANAFQTVHTSAIGALERGASVRQYEHASVVLKRRFAETTRTYEEFVLEPCITSTRFVDSEQLEFREYDTDYVAYGHQFYIGRVIDIEGPEPDADLVVRMRGISTSWKDAHAAHRVNDSRLKLALGPDAGTAFA